MKKTILFFIYTICLVSSVFATPATPITIFVAHKVITMNPAQPEATAVAVKDHRIFSVGSLVEMKSWMKPGTYTINTDFANDTITPGLIEAHAHWTMLVLFLGHPYVGYYDFLGYDAINLPGSKSKQDVISHLKEANRNMSNPNEALFAWGYDPIFFNNEDLTANDLDQVSKTRPVFVLNASGHIGYVNSVLLTKAGYNASTTLKGVVKGKDGNPNGALLEADAMAPVIVPLVNELVTPQAISKGVAGTGALAQRVGLTTASDLLFGGPGEDLLVSAFKEAANDPNYPVRVVAVYDGMLLTAMEGKLEGSGISHLNTLIEQNTSKLRFGAVKFVSDGSIQGFTARLKWPGYFNGAPNGIFNTSPPELTNAALPFWRAGFPIHVHVNGNQATDSALDTLAFLQKTAPNRNGIYVLEHDQMSSTEQFKRAHELGAYVNLFPNHIYYWGDQHYTTLLGPDRAKLIDNAAEAKRNGLIFSLHTDSPVTPLGPLHSMWSAVNRTTASGRVLGESARISAEDALRAVTINAAYLLNLQNEIGSIEIGKRADFTVLARNPISEPSQSIKDIPVVATISDGVVHLVPLSLRAREMGVATQ
jgi:predicted amidohydrolase YtcJ